MESPVKVIDRPGYADSLPDLLHVPARGKYASAAKNREVLQQVVEGYPEDAILPEAMVELFQNLWGPLLGSCFLLVAFRSDHFANILTVSPRS